MKTILDLTEDDSPTVDTVLPFPSHIVRDDEHVVIALREVEIHLTYSQLLEFSSNLNRWKFLDHDGEVPFDDPQYIEAAEHERLRALFRQIVDVGTVGKVDVPEELQRAIRWEFSLHPSVPWRSQEQRIYDLQLQLKELREKLRTREKRKGRAGARDAERDLLKDEF